MSLRDVDFVHFWRTGRTRYTPDFEVRDYLVRERVAPGRVLAVSGWCCKAQTVVYTSDFPEAAELARSSPDCSLAEAPSADALLFAGAVGRACISGELPDLAPLAAGVSPDLRFIRKYGQVRDLWPSSAETAANALFYLLRAPQVNWRAVDTLLQAGTSLSQPVQTRSFLGESEVLPLYALLPDYASRGDEIVLQLARWGALPLDGLADGRSIMHFVHSADARAELVELGARASEPSREQLALWRLRGETPLWIGRTVEEYWAALNLAEA